MENRPETNFYGDNINNGHRDHNPITKLSGEERAKWFASVHKYSQELEGGQETGDGSTSVFSKSELRNAQKAGINLEEFQATQREVPVPVYVYKQGMFVSATEQAASSSARRDVQQPLYADTRGTRSTSHLPRRGQTDNYHPPVEATRRRDMFQSRSDLPGTQEPSDQLRGSRGESFLRRLNPFRHRTLYREAGISGDNIQSTKDTIQSTRKLMSESSNEQNFCKLYENAVLLRNYIRSHKDTLIAQNTTKKAFEEMAVNLKNARNRVRDEIIRDDYYLGRDPKEAKKQHKNGIKLIVTEYKDELRPILNIAEKIYDSIHGDLPSYAQREALPSYRPPEFEQGSSSWRNRQVREDFERLWLI